MIPGPDTYAGAYLQLRLAWAIFVLAVKLEALEDWLWAMRPILRVLPGRKALALAFRARESYDRIKRSLANLQAMEASIDH